jgi:hypothetical protein
VRGGQVSITQATTTGLGEDIGDIGSNIDVAAMLDVNIASAECADGISRELVRAQPAPR